MSMQNTTKQKKYELPHYTTMAKRMNETCNSDGTLKNNDEVINESLSHFSPKQKQSIIKIFDECYDNLENLSK